MKSLRKFDEDKRIIGTPRYKYFQQMCSEASLFAIKEAKDRGLPITYVENNEVEIDNAVIKLLSDIEFRENLIKKGNILAEKQRNYSYFNEVRYILFDFQKIRKNWL